MGISDNQGQLEFLNSNQGECTNSGDLGEDIKECTNCNVTIGGNASQSSCN